MFVRSFSLSGVIISSCWLWWGPAVLNQNAPLVTVGMNGPSQGTLRHFWRSTGLSPPNRSDAAEFLLSQDERLNLALIGALPNRAITQVRVHWLLDLISVSDVGRNGSVVYDFTLLDQFLDHLLASGLSPGFELMGNPSDFLSDFSSIHTTLLWQDLVTQVTERYIGRYGLEHLSKWRFELWNEPDLKMYNIFNFTLKSYLRYARASRDGLNAAFAAGSYGVDPMLRLAGPAGVFKNRTRHPLCWGLLEYCAHVGRRACPVDLLTFHEKGAGSGEAVLRKGLRLVKDIHRLYPSLQEVPVANDEADPLTGWWRDKAWLADVRYAAMVTRGVTRHHQVLIRQEDINLQLLSNDNAFLNYHPYYFTQRTMMARFQYNETNPPHIQMFVKPVYTVMALLAYLGDTEMAVNIVYPDPRLTILAASTNQTRGNWDAAVLLTFSNETQLDNTKYLHVVININNIPALSRSRYDVFLLDSTHSPSGVWEDAGSPEEPDAGLRQRMRDAQGFAHPISEEVPESGNITVDYVMNLPSVLLIHVCARAEASPGQVVKLTAVNITFGEVMLFWIDEKVGTKCLSSYEVEYSSGETNPLIFHKVNTREFIFLSFQYVVNNSSHASDPTAGLYRVRAVDRWDRAGPYSTLLVYPEATPPIVNQV